MAIHAALVHIFSIIPSERVAEEIVEKVVRLSFDAQTGALSVVETPFITRSEIARLSFQDGWVTEATIEDIKLAPGGCTVMYRNYGGDWAANGVAREMKIGVPPLRFAGMRCSRPPGSFRVHFMRNALATSLRAWPLSRRMGVFGEFEREIVREQVVTRLARAKVHGRKSGKPIGRPAVS